MKTILGSRKTQALMRFSVFLFLGALIAGMAGCTGDGYTPSQNLEIRTWYDLDAVRNNLAGKHTLMNDLDSTMPGYEELASPTANNGTGWQPIGTEDNSFTGTFDGQGHEIRDLFVNRPDEDGVGLFGVVGLGGVIKDTGVMNVTVSGRGGVGGLAGGNDFGTTVSNCYSSGSVNGDGNVGGLVGANYGTVSNSYSTGSVTGEDVVGGLVGILAYGGAAVSNSYSTGNVTGNMRVGGLIGSDYYADNVSNSFWDIETSGQATSDGGTAKNTTEMQDIATFSGAGWNITAVANASARDPAYIWNIVDNVTYPFLSWQPV